MAPKAKRSGGKTMRKGGSTANPGLKKNKRKMSMTSSDRKTSSKGLLLSIFSRSGAM